METQSSPKHLMNNTRMLAQAAATMVADSVQVAEAAYDAASERRKQSGSRKCSFSSSSGYSSSAGTMSLFDVRCQSREQSSEDIRLRDNADVVETLVAPSESFGPQKFSLQLTYSLLNMTMDPEVDSRDTPPSTEPLHIVGALEDLPPATRSLNKTLPTPVTPRKPPLTLSAFRRPEETVRLTNCDASRLLENEYNLRAAGCRVIGHGAFSTVRLAVRFSDGQKVAVKSLSKFDALRARRLRRGGSSSSFEYSRHMDEWEIMRLLKNNPYVLALFDVFETDEEIHLVTEYCEGGELFDAIKRKGAKRSSFRRGRYSEAQAARITNQILRALLDLHDLGIVHRDIKPENILLLNNDESDIQVKLADFGMARLHTFSSDPAVSIIDGESSPSTPGLSDVTNAPPEMYNSKTAGPSADIFSLGVTLYILLCGFPPVFCDGLVEFPDAYWGDISDEAKAVVRAMVHPDPSRRISVRSALTTPWVRQQATRVRRDSISANLELVRSRLHKALGGDNHASASSQKRRRGSLSTYSPKKQRRLSTQMAISMTDLYAISEKRNVRVIDELIETHPIVDDVSSEQ